MHWKVWGCLILLAASGCRTYDDSRVLQTLNQRGFGRRATGDANEIYTVGIGDSIRIIDPLNPEISGAAAIRMDGVIALPLIGEVYINGFSTDEIASALNQRYREYYNAPNVQVFIDQTNSKFFYVRGEVARGGRLPFTGDTLVWDVVMQGPTPITADISDIYVIRADPNHPLIIPVDLQKLLDHGDARDNIEIRQDDIIVVNPNFAGYVKNAVSLVLAPVQPLLQLATSVRNLETIYDSFVNDTQFFVGNRNGGGFNNFGGGGGGGNLNTFSTSGATVPKGGSGS